MTTGQQVERVTPAAYLATDAEPGTDEWFEARRGGITGTDLPKILGDVDPDERDAEKRYGNSLSVWLDKRGELPDEDVGEAAEWGHVLEDPVAQVWAERNDLTVQRIGVIANAEQEWMRASLDRIVLNCPDAGEDGICGLEIKTRSAFKAGTFNEDIPDSVLAQVAWGRRVSGLPHMHVAVLIGGQRLLQFTYDRDDELEDFLVAQARPVWECVETGNPPEVEPDRDGVMLDLLNLLYPDRAGDRDLDPEKARTWLAQYEAGDELEKEGKALKEQAKTGLVVMLDDGDTGKVDDEVVFTYKRPAASPKLAAAEMKRLQKQDPDTYARLLADGFIVVSQGGPRFNRK